MICGVGCRLGPGCMCGLPAGRLVVSFIVSCRQRHFIDRMLSKALNKSIEPTLQVEHRRANAIVTPCC